MIYQTKLALQTLMQANQTPVTGDLRDFKSIYKGDWQNVDIRQQPSISIEWGGSFNFETLFNPCRATFELHLVIKATEPHDPDKLAEKLELLLYSMGLTSEWGLLPFLKDNRTLSINGGTHSMLLTPTVAEPVILANPDQSFSGSVIVVVKCENES